MINYTTQVCFKTLLIDFYNELKLITIIRWSASRTKQNTITIHHPLEKCWVNTTLVKITLRALWRLGPNFFFSCTHGGYTCSPARCCCCYNTHSLTYFPTDQQVAALTGQETARRREEGGRMRVMNVKKLSFEDRKRIEVHHLIRR